VSDAGFVDALDELATLLRACNQIEHAKWTEERRALAAASTGDQLAEVKKEVRGILAGMGSLSDLFLVPEPGSGFDAAEARRRQFELVDRLDALTAH
jgi:hypothetical protein